MTQQNRLPDCPSCGSSRSVYEDGDRNFFCNNCKVTFDDLPDEGGDYSRDPVRSAIRKEEWQQREAARKREAARQWRMNRVSRLN